MEDFVENGFWIEMGLANAQRGRAVLRLQRRQESYSLCDLLPASPRSSEPWINHNPRIHSALADR